MAEQQQQHAPGGHYSGANPVPTVKKFIENLDKDKAARDRKLDEQERERKKQAAATGEAVPHKPQKAGLEGTQKVVTDPTTGREVTIEDVSKSMMDQVENPQLSVPNANLQKDTVRYLFCNWKNVISLPRIAHQDRPEPVTRGIQAQPRCHRPSRSSRRRYHFRCAHPWRENKHPIPSNAVRQL